MAAGAVAGVLMVSTAMAQSQPKLPVPLPVPRGRAPAAAPAAAPAPAAQAPAPEPSSGPRDPFAPLVRKPSPGEERRFQEITSLKLVGVVWDARNPEAIRALVETPDGLGYYLRLDDERFGGKVTAVERDRVRFLVREQIPGAGTRERSVELKLAKPEER